MIPKNHIVVSRYNEDFSWVNSIRKENAQIFIYNKGEEIYENFLPGIRIINLKNVGRESHTYIYHILENYNSLPEKIIFTQANPFDHVHEDFISRFINFLDSDSNFEYFSKNILGIKILDDGAEEEGNLDGIFWRNKHSLDSPCLTIPSQIISDLKHKDWRFGAGAIFGTSKHRIIKKSREFYTGCLRILSESSDPVNPPEGHAFERLWYLIFNL